MIVSYKNIRHFSSSVRIHQTSEIKLFQANSLGNMKPSGRSCTGSDFKRDGCEFDANSRE